MFSSSPFSAVPFSELGISSIKIASVLDALAIVEASASLEIGVASSIDAVAVLEADGTLTLGGANAQLTAVADILANATIDTTEIKLFIWTIPGRETTWTLPKDVGVYTWVIPQGVGASTWIIPN